MTPWCARRLRQLCRADESESVGEGSEGDGTGSGGEGAASER